MTNRIRDASWIESVGYDSRHGPYARGEPLIRGKPPEYKIRGIPTDVYSTVISTFPVILSEVEGSLSNEVTVNNMRFPIKLGMTARGKPGSWLHRESRVLAAIKSDDEVGVFIPNRDCYVWEEMRELEEMRECRDERKGEENVEYRMMNNECRSIKKLEVRSRESKALKRRQAIAQGNALGLNVQTVPIAPRLNIVQGGNFAWGKTNGIEDCGKVKNRSLSSQYIKNGSIELTKENIQQTICNVKVGRLKTVAVFKMGVVVSEPRL